MRASGFLLAAAALLSCVSRAATPEEQFRQADACFTAAQALEREGKLRDALIGFDDAAVQLDQLKEAKPPWNLDVVINRLEDCHTRESLVRFRLAELNDPVVAPAPSFVVTQQYHETRNDSYPWRIEIPASIFILGRDAAAVSLDPHWVRENGGEDTASNMSGYASGLHASTMNPFYVGLPFNDVAHPDLALRWLPRGWTPARVSPLGSACLGRWVEIRSRFGRSCFAQWEAADPADGNDAAYVFGTDPAPKNAAGLFISQAVAKYLGLEQTGVVSWRFVDDADVPSGLWLRYGEQAILFSALRDMKAGSSSPTTVQGH